MTDDPTQPDSESNSESNSFDPTDPIAKAWANQEVPMTLSFDPIEMAATVAKGHYKHQRRIFWLNVREVVPALVVSGFFISEASNAEHPVAIYASVALILLVMVFLVAKSLQHHKSDQAWGSSLRDQLNQRVAQLGFSAKLLRLVFWWYLLPIFGGILLFIYGMTGSLREVPAGIWAFFAAIFVGGYFLNWWSARKMEAERDQLTPLLDEFD